MSLANTAEPELSPSLKAQAEGDFVGEHSRYSFYFKLTLLYFLNLVDWFCTEALISSGYFYEANPIMQPVFESFWLTLLVKGALPLLLIGICAIIFKLADTEETLTARIVLYIGITAYALVNLWHIFNFVLLFCSF
jgi:hypothetical protein